MAAIHIPSRRRFLELVGTGLAAAYVPGVFAQALVETPRQTEGPFYPDVPPLDTDNDLIVINDALTPAVGEITHLSGRVLSASGEPLRGLIVEIWQVDHQGAYLHSRSDNRAGRDRNFQGFGRFATSSNGEYFFRTIRPVPDPGRTPHIHVKVKRGDRDVLTTQCYINGHPQNARDGVLRAIRDARARESVLVDFVPSTGAGVPHLTARFDIVLGVARPS